MVMLSKWLYGDNIYKHTTSISDYIESAKKKRKWQRQRLQQKQHDNEMKSLPFPIDSSSVNIHTNIYIFTYVNDIYIHTYINTQTYLLTMNIERTSTTLLLIVVGFTSIHIDT